MKSFFIENSSFESQSACHSHLRSTEFEEALTTVLLARTVKNLLATLPEFFSKLEPSNKFIQNYEELY